MTGRDEWPTVECAICGEDVSLKNARSGIGRKPVHGECFLAATGAEADP